MHWIINLAVTASGPKNWRWNSCAVYWVRESDNILLGKFVHWSPVLINFLLLSIKLYPCGGGESDQ